ncbi:uncharacterized protein LOC144821639 [Lissotriton helveticus]
MLQDSLFQWTRCAPYIFFPAFAFEALNNNEVGLKFTFNLSSSEIEFLDTKVYVRNNKLETTVHRKKTATNSILHGQSFHPESLKRSIPYGELLRMKRNCSEENEMERKFKETKTRFMQRGYKMKDVVRGENAAREMHRDEMLVSGDKMKKPLPKKRKTIEPETIITDEQPSRMEETTSEDQPRLIMSWQEVINSVLFLQTYHISELTVTSLLYTNREKTGLVVGDRVLSRWRVDGFYYAGQVMHHMDKQHVLVCFDMGILQNTEKHFLITEAETSSNSVKVRKHVLLKTRPVNGMPIIRYVPAILTFQKPKKKPSNILTVTTYREKQLRVSASDVVTISESKYNFILKHLARAQKENHEIMYGPEPYFSRPRAITPKTFVTSDPDNPEDSGTNSPSKHKYGSADTKSSRKANVQNLKLHSFSPPESITSSSDSGETTEKSEYFTSENSETTSESVSWSHPETPESFSTPGSQKPQEGFNSGRSQEAAADPLLHTVDVTGREPKPEDSIQQQRLEEERKMVALMQEFTNNLKRVNLKNGDRVPSLQPPKESLEQVLARNPATGWYSPGRLIHNYNNEAFLVQTEDKTLITLYPQDIIQDSEDKSTVIQAGDAVVCPYPMIDVQYCPATVLQDLPMMWLQVQYYDGTEGYVAQEETYVISDAKKEKITAEIVSQEEAIIGRTVVARNDKDGIYYIGTVAPREWKGPRFVIEWTNGSQSIQLATHMFAILPEMHNLGVGSHVLAVADDHPESFAYMPGMVMKTNNKEWHVQFINGQSALLHHRNQMYRISEKYYKLSEMFFEKVH